MILAYLTIAQANFVDTAVVVVVVVYFCAVLSRGVFVLFCLFICDGIIDLYDTEIQSTQMGLALCSHCARGTAK